MGEKRVPLAFQEGPLGEPLAVLLLAGVRAEEASAASGPSPSEVAARPPTSSAAKIVPFLARNGNGPGLLGLLRHDAHAPPVVLGLGSVPVPQRRRRYRECRGEEETASELPKANGKRPRPKRACYFGTPPHPHAAHHPHTSPSLELRTGKMTGAQGAGATGGDAVDAGKGLGRGFA